MTRDTMIAKRLQKGLSQEKLAHNIDVTRQTINLIERGKYNPSLKIMKKIAKELDSSLDELFGD
ncbi:MAG: helix-turn-helix transcriptional regulator [Fusobacteria bacterium]|nr:helix-turn-helix transcriptional regulator [Fusobacteriota bacterium]